ncbi:MAG: T9SS type A sorting domain-containing protein [Candidatus Marinimicrobia bacterium]|nr:T9SS type A sorting domain-containing protein [Candidatus Neomarinimicrobiota bacterium]
MNKIIVFLILTAMAFPSYVTFNVDMSQEDVGEEYPTLWMGAYYPDPGFAMTDPDGDGVWSITLDLDPATYTFKYRNGAWQEWDTGSGWESLLGQDCAVGQWSDREVIVGAADMVLETVCFSSCTSECITITNYDVTFQVDMNDVDGFNPADGVYLQGSFNGWCGICNPMSDATGDGIYTLTISLPESPSYEYIYTTNGWEGLQGFAPLNSSCDFVPGDEYANYGFSLSGGNLILDVTAFGCCSDGDCGDGGGSTSTVTFDLDGVADCDFVSVTGSFDNWSGWGATTDTGMEAQVPAGDHEFKILCVDQSIDGWWEDIWGSSTEYGAPLGSECDWDPTDEYNNYGFTIGSETTLTVSYCAGECGETCEGCSSDLGDVNGDGGWNVLDIVALVNCVLASTCGGIEGGCSSDMNGDTSYNVLDIVQLANCVLADNCGGRVDDANHSKLIIEDNMVSIEADGFIGGVQMTLAHGDDFSIEMTDRALLADYLTTGNETRLLVITPETEDLFIYEGDFEIIEIIVANTQYEVSVDFPLATSFSISDAYPNPFNPTTQMSLTLTTAADVSVNVFNMNGQLVDVIADGQMSSGTYSFTWNGTNAPSGIYFIKTEVGREVYNQKIMLIK